MSKRAIVNTKKPERKTHKPGSILNQSEFSQSIGSLADQVLHLQRSIGNQAVERLIRSGALQAKLKIGPPGDRYEQEADRMADAVMKIQEPKSASIVLPHIQRDPRPGQLTANREGGPLRIHWPGGVSGVTIGRGYDLGTRSAAAIRHDLEGVGVPDGQITFLEGAAGLRGPAADAWVIANREDPRATITVEQRDRLFSLIWPRYVERARIRATAPTRRGNSFISQERWQQLHHAVREILTDLAYVGAPYARTRREQINTMLMDESQSSLDQLKWLRAYIKALPRNLQGRHGGELRVNFIDEIIRHLDEKS